MTQPEISIGDLLNSSCQRLQQAGVTDSPRLDCELLLCHLLDKPRSYVFTWPEKLLDQNIPQQFDSLLQKRLEHQPIAYLIGYKEFWGLNLKTSPATLIPRNDTEILVETALEILANRRLADHPIELLDMGTGTGAIALAIKSERPDIKVSALDFQAEAVTLAKHNAQQLNLNIDVLQSDWFEALDSDKSRFDMIVSNPPYIEEQDPHLTEGDVQFEPLSALIAGQSGLDDIELLINQARFFLQPGGWLILEHGYNQAKAVEQIFTQFNYINYRLIKDLANIPRISLAQYQITS